MTGGERDGPHNQIVEVCNGMLSDRIGRDEYEIAAPHTTHYILHLSTSGHSKACVVNQT